MNKEKNGFIIGMLLGDGHFNKNRNSIDLTHGLKQKAYLKLKMKLAKEAGFTISELVESTRKTNVGIHASCRASIKIGDSKLNDLSFVDKIKKLTPLGLLIWWVDDGNFNITKTKCKNDCKTSRFGYLNTQRFSLQDNEIISKELESKFNISTTINKDTKSGVGSRDNFRLYLNTESMKKLIDVFRNYVPLLPTDVYYKVNMGFIEGEKKFDKKDLKYNF